MTVHTSTQKYDIVLARGFQKHLSDPSRKNGVIDKGKYQKRTSKGEWNKREYNDKNRNYVTHTMTKVSFDKTQFHALSFCGPQAKLHGEHGLRIIIVFR